MLGHKTQKKESGAERRFPFFGFCFNKDGNIYKNC